jgi:hypothetical protein
LFIRSIEKKKTIIWSSIIRKKIKICKGGIGISTSKIKLLFVLLSSSFQEYIVEENEQPEEFLMQLCQQAESMRVMINTTNYDYGQIKAKMDTTYSHRQQLVREMKPIKDIIELYPGLSITNLVST